MVKPIADSLEKVGLKIEELDRARAGTEGKLTAQLRQVAETTTSLHRETGNLVTALRRPQTRGQWGEIQLRNVCEMSGKLVTSAALVLMFAFFALSLSPGFEVKQFAIGLAAGIIFDATVIRALLVPSVMRLLGDANWWMPAWAHRPLLIRAREELPEAATESA